MSMQIHVNGEIQELPEATTLAQLLKQLQLAKPGQRLAVEINQQIIPRSQHADCKLHSGDRVEIVWAIGGG